jgi:VWFA-related protein
MKLSRPSLTQAILAVLVVSSLAGIASAQKRERKPPVEQADEVVTVNTELVQSDVTVFDKQGRFVDGLRPEQFELRVDGKPQPIAFFERVTAGSFAEERQLTAARNKATANGSQATANQNTGANDTGAKDASKDTSAQSASASARDRGRVIFFFADDRHLTFENVTRTRVALLQFVENEMQQNDLVAVVSTSGRVGFLQQLTSNKAVLREAIARLTDQRKTEAYAGKVPISEYDADQVALAHNRELFTYLVEATAAEFQMDPGLAANMVRNRVAQIEVQGRTATTDTLMVLESLIRSSAPLPGRKIVFFISGGFVSDPRGSDVLDRLQRVTRTAAEVGAVIYTMDARGTFVNIYTDASTNPYPDFTGHVSRNVFAEGQATQESLHILADDTGGRAFLGSNSFADGFRQALTESSNYYLLAWRPARAEDRSGKARFAVTIKGRPELKVRLRRGFINLSRTASFAKMEKKGAPGEVASSPEAELLRALGSLYPVRALPVSLSVGYVNTPTKGMMLTASMQIDLAALEDVGPTAGQSVDQNIGQSAEQSVGQGLGQGIGQIGVEKREIDVLGVALDDRGSISSFKQKLSINPADVVKAGERAVLWNQDLFLRAGLYQVRLAVRDRQSGRTGSAMQWIEIQPVETGTLSMSSIFIGERARAESSTEKVRVSVTRSFNRGSRLRYQTFVYNAASGADADATIQVEILRDGRTVQTQPPAKLLTTAADSARISFSGEIELDQLPAGRYVLQILATEKKSGTTISRQTDFIVADQ